MIGKHGSLLKYTKISLELRPYLLQSKNMLGEVLVEVVGQRLALGIELDDVDVDVDLDDDDDDRLV